MPHISSPIFLPWCTLSFFRQLQYSDAEKLPETSLQPPAIAWYFMIALLNNSSNVLLLSISIRNVPLQHFSYLSGIVSYIPQMRQKLRVSAFFGQPSMCSIHRSRQALSWKIVGKQVPVSAILIVQTRPFAVIFRIFTMIKPPLRSAITILM